MPDNTITTLSIIQKAGLDAYPGVADRVYAVYEAGDEFDRQYAIACMGAMKDTNEAPSPATRWPSRTTTKPQSVTPSRVRRESVE